MPIPIRIALLVAMAAIIAIQIISLARAHEFYATACCSGRDCAPVPDAVVRQTPDGIYVSPLGTTKPPTFLPWGDRRLKQIPWDADVPYDQKQKWHVCTGGGRPDGTLFCVYMPQGGA